MLSRSLSDEFGLVVIECDNTYYVKPKTSRMSRNVAKKMAIQISAILSAPFIGTRRATKALMHKSSIPIAQISCTP